MKLVQRTARKDKSGKHNDRNFNLDHASHIAQDRCRENKYYTYNGETEQKFCNIEQAYYQEHFAGYLEKKNQKRKAINHKERIQKMSDYYKSRNSRPEDMLIQIGDMNDHVSGEQLWAVANLYRQRFDEAYGEHCKILTMALHMDEATPHIHIRRVWQAEDEKGDLCVSQHRGLSALGFVEENTEKDIGKYNNAKKTFSRTDRTILRNVCEELGIDIEPDRGIPSEHLDTIQYKLKKDTEVHEHILSEINLAELRLEEIRKETENLLNIRQDYEMMQDYLHQKGLNSDFEEFCKGKERKELDNDIIQF